MTDTETTAESGTVFLPYLPRLVVDWGAQPAARVLDGSLLGLDISGFTALSERLGAKGKLGAEELITLISETYSELIDTASRYGGDVLKFRGDALLLFFDESGHEQRAALAGLAMQARMDAAASTESSVGPVRLSMSGGIVSGDCHFFLVGSRHRELIVCGPSASTALQLEDASEAGEILVSPRTAEALEPGHVAGERDGAYLLRRDAFDGNLPSTVAARDGADDLSHLVSPSLRTPIEMDAVEAEHRHATAAFVKFTDGDELVNDLSSATAALQALAAVTSEVTTELGVTWLESDIDRGGGKLYLVAGAPYSPGGDEERMLRAARAIVDAGVGPPVAVGINRGPVFAGAIGSRERRTYAVMGDTVNLAARLVARAQKGEILVTGDVLQRSRARFETSARQFLMKGKEQPVTGFSVGRFLEETAADERHQLPLVGRDSEVAVLREAVEAARLRQSRAVELVGEPGIGKSRLAEEIGGLAVGFQQLNARCELYSASTPFAPFRTLLRPLIGVLEDESPEDAGAKLTAFTQSVMPDLAGWLPLLALPFDAAVEPTAEVDETDPKYRRDRLHEVLDQFLTRLLLMPTVLVVEDTHWLDDASQLVLARLAQPAPRPWLIVTTRRPSTVTPLPSATVLELQALDAADARLLALSAAGASALSEEELTALTERAGGNPLFVRELAIAPSTDEDLPESVETLLTSRIDTLDPDDRRLLRHASVIGFSFDLDLLAEILPDAGADPERWSRLSDFVQWEGGSLLRFRHDLVRAAAYGGLSFQRRREIHARVGEALERHVDDAEEIAALLSLHFLAAGQFDKAWGYAVAAGDDARAKYANVDAAILYERALAAAGDLTEYPVATADVSESLGDVYELTARFELAAGAYGRAAADADDPTTIVRRLRKQGIIDERLGRYGDARTRYDEALARGAGVEQSELVEVENAIATVLYRQGKIEECVEWCERATQRASSAGDRRGLAHSYYVRAAAEGNRSGPARDYLELALPIYQEIGDLVTTSSILSNMGVPAYYAGDWEEAMRCYAAGRTMAQRAGHVVGAANATNNEAEILLDQGRLDEARALLEEALRAYRASGFGLGVPLATLNLGRAAALAGEFHEARELLAAARAGFEEMGADSFAFTARSRQAEALVLEGHHSAARELAAETLAVSELAGERGTLTAQLERLLGYAHAQARELDAAQPHFDASLAVARETGASYEEALTLRALADTKLGRGSEQADATAIFARLGVISLPEIPLP